MTGKVLLDSNIVIALFGGENNVKIQLALIHQVFVPSIVIGELLYGAQKSSQFEQNLMRVNEFANDNVILACDVETARQYGKIKFSLQQKGRPIPENDIWIAAIAMQHRLPLASRDQHFDEVDGLSVLVW